MKTRSLALTLLAWVVSTGLVDAQVTENSLAPRQGGTVWGETFPSLLVPGQPRTSGNRYAQPGVAQSGTSTTPVGVPQPTAAPHSSGTAATASHASTPSRWPSLLRQPDTAAERSSTGPRSTGPRSTGPRSAADGTLWPYNLTVVTSPNATVPTHFGSPNSMPTGYVQVYPPAQASSPVPSVPYVPAHLASTRNSAPAPRGDDLLLSNRGQDDLLAPKNPSDDDLLAPNNSSDDLLAPSPDAGADDPLSSMSQQPPGRASQALPGAGHGTDQPDRSTVPAGSDPHADVFADTLYPSALRCAKCHQKIYDEWRVSAHAYAAISPMFQRFEQAITVVSQGTIGTFCVRCHAPVATQMCYPRDASIADGAAVFREGITCVACHRVVERYGRVNGERRIEPGDIFQPVVGNIGGDGIARVAADADNYKVKLHAGDKRPGQELHQGAIKFEQLGKSDFCVSCHQVAVHPGIALEVVWAQYRASPARARGVSCQDCHMGIEPGKANGYSCGPAAEMSGKVVDANRKHSNHMFHGPGNSIAHPGIFPHNEKSLRWSIEQWLEFDWRAGWGTPEFEKHIINSGVSQEAFPPAWRATDDRRDARKIVDDNFKLLGVKREMAQRTMNNAAQIEGPEFHSQRRAGETLHIKYRIHNTSDGHNMPTGSLGAQPQLWLNVVLTGPDGRWLWESGYLDGNGDLADMHSMQVRRGLIKPDLQLMNLQTKFLITGVKGTDREMYLPINVDQDQLPFLRPGAVPISVLNHPPLIRMEAHSVPPLGYRLADYRIPGELLKQPGTYRLSVRMRSRMEPIYFMRFCTATPEMERRMLEQTLDVQPNAVEFEIY